MLALHALELESVFLEYSRRRLVALEDSRGQTLDFKSLESVRDEVAHDGRRYPPSPIRLADPISQLRVSPEHIAEKLHADSTDGDIFFGDCEITFGLLSCREANPCFRVGFAVRKWESVA